MINREGQKAHTDRLIMRWVGEGMGYVVGEIVAVHGRIISQKQFYDSKS